MDTELNDRFWRLVDKSGNCWVWKGTKTARGYGLISIKGVMRRAHRVVLGMVGREITDGKVVDHICRNHVCVNPQHLRVVSNWENTMYGNNHIGKNPFKTHCPKGHEYSPQNTTIWEGERHCRACVKSSNHRFKERNPGYFKERYHLMKKQTIPC